MSPSRTVSRRAEPGSRTWLRTNPVITTSCSSASGNASYSGAPISLLFSITEVSKTYPAISASATAGFSLCRPDGSSRQPINATNRTPTTATTMPTGAKSNIRNGLPSASSRTVATTILGGVPIRVTMPPRIVAKESGIRVRLGLRSPFRAASMSTGINSDSAATLFMTADSRPPTPDIRPIWGPIPLTPDTHTRAIASTTPELKRPRLTIRTRAMITVAG